MPNNTRTRPDGDYVNGVTLSRSDWEDLDRKIFGSWNGVRGGAYAGTGTHSIGGSGILVTSQIRLTAAGAILGDGTAFQIQSDNWPKLSADHKGALRKIVQPIHAYRSPTPHMWTRNHPYGGIGSVALACRLSFSRNIEVPELYVPLRVVDGSTMSQIEFRFRVMSQRTAAPIAMPKFRILQVPFDTNTSSPMPLKSTSDGTGFDSPALVTSPSDWYANGNAQGFVYTCDQNNVIDVSRFHYVAHIVEERGTQTPDDPYDGFRLIERKHDSLLTWQNANALRGYSGVDQDGLPPRVLVIDDDITIDSGLTTPISSQNGIWSANANAGVRNGYWWRAEDLDQPTDFTKNWIIRVLTGAIDSASTWQCQYPSSANRMVLDAMSLASATVPDGYTPAITLDQSQIQITPPIPRGNIYHSLVPTFQVADLRFQ